MARDVAGNEANENAVNVNVQNAGVPQNGGLIGYWALNETSGTTAADSSGSGNQGTVVTGTDLGGCETVGRLIVQWNAGLRPCFRALQRWSK